MGAEFGPGGVPLPSDPDLYAWYVGEDGIGADGIAETPFWSNRQGELGRDIYPSFSPSGGTAVRIDNAHNGNDALEYVDRVSWRGASDPRPPAAPTSDGWGTLDVSLAGATVFAVANFPQADKAFLFQGNNGGASGVGAWANFSTPNSNSWEIKGSSATIETAPLELDTWQTHSFVFTADGFASHYVNGVLAGDGFVGAGTFSGFIIGGREGGNQRASGLFGELAVYQTALSDADRQQVEGYLRNRWLANRFDLNSDGAVDAADAGIMFGVWGGPGVVSNADLNSDGFVDAADAGLLFEAWTGDPMTPAAKAATAEYNAETGELKISSAGAVNVFVQSASNQITPINPPPAVPVGLLTNNTGRVGITNLGPIEVTNFSFGNIGKGLAMSDLKLVYTTALGTKGIEVPASGEATAAFRYIPEPAGLGLMVVGLASLLAARRRS